MSPHWIKRSFRELNSSELYAILQLRQKVFVLEQQCLYQDLDNLDQHADHLMAWDGQDLVAYLRVLPKDIPYRGYSSLGRVIADPKYRGQGIGHELVRKGIEIAKNQNPLTPIKIGAQFYLQRFYAEFGFEPVGQIYDEDGIDHIHMIKK